MGFFIPFFIALLGLILGCAVNYLADQLPITGSLGHISCPACRSKMSPGKYITLDRCLICKSTRNLRSWLVQFGLALIAVLLWFFPHSRLPWWDGLILFAYFILVAVIDIEHHLVLGPVSLAGVLIGGSAGIYLHGVFLTIAGGALGALIMVALYFLGRMFSRWVSRQKGKEMDPEALGFGDVYIAGILGLALGWPGVTAGLLIAILMGGLTSGLFLLWLVLSKQYRPFTALPYAPFLLLAAALLIFR
jgi:leader peptidase (prepilin peptidase)/N-methyltransferase